MHTQLEYRCPTFSSVPDLNFMTSNGVKSCTAYTERNINVQKLV